MMRLICLTLLLVTATGCTRKNASGRTPQEFLFSPKAKGAAALPWKDWSPAIFEEAQNSGKPVFLSLTRGLCSWCVLLDESTLSNERVAELLRSKFILVRVNTDIYPELGNHFGAEGIPRMAILNAKADVVWDGPVMQPTLVNQKLNAALRKELTVKMSAGQSRYDPNPDKSTQNHLDAEYPISFLKRFLFDFDNEFKGYAANGKTLSFAGLEFDLKLGYLEWHLPESRIRMDTHLDSVFTHLYDKHDGGFLTGTRDAAWNDFIPVKKADEQAAMAAILSVYSYWAGKGVYFARSATEASTAAETTVAYLEQRLIDDGHVFTGEMGTRDYYRSERRGSFAGTQTNSVLQTSVAARLADGLAEAGYWSGKHEWIDKAAQLAKVELSHRLPNGLFWHVKHVTANRLEDATAMLGAMLSLYTATADESWLTEAERIATDMEPLYSPEGYYLDVTAGSTGGTLQGEPIPMLNAATALSLRKLAVLTDNPAWDLRAEKVAGQFAISPTLFLNDEAYFAKVVWQVTRPMFRLEVPRAWQTQAAAERLIHPASTRVVIRWIDGSRGRACFANKCSAYFEQPAKLDQASQLALSTVQSPVKADLKNPFFQ